MFENVANENRRQEMSGRIFSFFSLKCLFRQAPSPGAGEEADHCLAPNSRRIGDRYAFTRPNTRENLNEWRWLFFIGVSYKLISEVLDKGTTTAVNQNRFFPEEAKSNPLQII